MHDPAEVTPATCACAGSGCYRCCDQCTYDVHCTGHFAPPASAADIAWWNCEDCIFHRDADWLALHGVLASIGIERGMTVAEVAFEYFNGYHRRGHVSVSPEAEMRDLEQQMYALNYDDPERAKIVRRYNALCDKLGVPSGDK